MTKTQLQQGHEYIRADEDSIAAEMVAELEAQMTDMYKDKKMLRQVHTTMHGCVKAAFIIEPDLPEGLRVGVFSHAKSHHAWVRFSNGNTKPQADGKKVLRGVAIKLMSVPGEKLLPDEHLQQTQDFLLMSNETFFSKNVKEFRKMLSGAVSSNPLKLLLYFLNPLHWGILGRLGKTMIHCSNPLELSYWSTQPYQFGKPGNAVKYLLKPHAGNHLLVANTSDYNYLRINLAQTLNNNEANFDFYIQFQTDANAMPVEDPTVAWTSEYIKLATLKIVPQVFDSNEQMEFGENLSFNPWHSLPEHRPLGSFNRARKRVYEVMSKFRHQHNKVAMTEPKDSHDFLETGMKENNPVVLEQAIPKTNMVMRFAEVIIDCDKATAYNFVSSVDKLPDWLTTTSPLTQGIRNVEVMVGHWAKVGHTRKVVLDNGDHVIEELTRVNLYANYAYQTTGFVDVFRFVTNKTFGECWFDTIDNKTRVRWVYIFTYKNLLCMPVVWLFMTFFFKPFMQNGLNNAKAIIESQD